MPQSKINVPAVIWSGGFIIFDMTLQQKNIMNLIFNFFVWLGSLLYPFLDDVTQRGIPFLSISWKKLTDRRKKAFPYPIFIT